VRDTRRIIRILDKKGVDHRRPNERRKRGRYIIKGPNRVWSMDGHDKLAKYRF
jgi:hypothetical protein